MGWRDLLRTEEPVVAPWSGGRTLHSGARTFSLEGKLPDEHGIHEFVSAGGRKVTWKGPSATTPDSWFAESKDLVTGYLIGDRLVPDGAAVPVDVRDLVARTETVYLVEPGLDRYARVTAARHTDKRLYYVRQEFPLGPEEDVRTAYVDRAESIAHVPHVTPALDLAFRVTVWQRQEVDRRRAELERREREERERAEAEALKQKLVQSLGDGATRRIVAAHDFETAARAALKSSGAELLDHRPGYKKGEVVVQFRFQGRRFECVCDQGTLRIVDAGICLIDHATGERGDTRFTLESLPGVILEAMRGGKLVVFRHVDR